MLNIIIINSETHLAKYEKINIFLKIIAIFNRKMSVFHSVVPNALKILDSVT